MNHYTPKWKSGVGSHCQSEKHNPITEKYAKESTLIYRSFGGKTQISVENIQQHTSKGTILS